MKNRDFSWDVMGVDEDTILDIMAGIFHGIPQRSASGIDFGMI